MGMIEKATFFLEQKITAHIDTEDKMFFNGLIIEVNKDFLILNDRVVGETKIAFSEIAIFRRFVGDMEKDK